MNTFFIRELVNNVALLLSLALLNNFSHEIFKKRNLINYVLQGIIIGLVCIAIMMNPLTFDQGLVFDTRSIHLGISALFFNPISVLIAGSMSILYRISVGGVGLPMGIATVVVVVSFGFLWRYQIDKKIKLDRTIKLLIFGVIIHTLMMMCLVLLPQDVASRIFNALFLDIMIIYPIGTLLLGLLMYQQKDHAELQVRMHEDELVYRSIFENNLAVMMLIEPSTGKIIDVNKSSEQFYGYSRSELLSMNIGNINTLSQKEIYAEMTQAKEEKKHYFEFKHRKADGTIVNVEVYSGPINRSGRQLLYSIVHDISPKVKAQSALLERDRLLMTLLNRSPYAIFVQLDGKIWFINQTACELFGVNTPEQLLGTPLFDRFLPADHPFMKERLHLIMNEGKEVLPAEVTFLKVDGSKIQVHLVSALYEWNGQRGTMAFARDITKEKEIQKDKDQLEGRIRQQQKLESIGLLAGGVAHEINNPLSGILNYAEIIKDMDTSDKVKEFAKEIIQETERISEIVRNLLQFSRMEKQSHSYARIEDIISRTLSLTTSLLHKDNIQIDVSIEANLPEIKCRSQQIQQVLLNLVTNARDSLNDKYPNANPLKKIEITCQMYHKDQQRWFALAVKDYGLGIEEAHKQKLFEPFYSTKPKDKGTGLGLSISYGIIKDHHGDIEVNTKLNDYCQFILHLPVDNGWDHEGEING